MAKWRPEGWRDKFKADSNTSIIVENSILCNAETIFEAGADAMLEALIKSEAYISVREDGIHIVLPTELVDDGYPPRVKESFLQCWGKWVFIPDN